LTLAGEIRQNGRMPAAGGRCVTTCSIAFALAIAPLCGHAAEPSRSLAGKAWSGAQDVAIYALGLIGVTYKFGGNTPDSGLDCSGFVRYVFQEVTGVSLPRTSKEMSGLGARVGANDLMPGDLVFFNTRRFAYSHVGIYLGDNRFVHAPSVGSEVEIAQMSGAYWQKRFDGARRVVGVMPALVPTVAMARAFPAETAPGWRTSRPYAIDPADATP